MNKSSIKLFIIVIVIIFIIFSSLGTCIKSIFIKVNRSKNNVYKNKIEDDNDSINFYKENKNILLQVYILKNTILMNNSVLKSYNQIFSHNINYINYQKNSISREINIANSSINSELNILNEMKNIMKNHPYNYSYLFQVNNYYIPKISTNNNKKASNKVNNIKSFSSKLNKKSTNINSIFYQSEENIVGIESNISVVSSLKLFIFKKVNFKYSNILYFSHNLNNLSTFDKYSENSHHKIDNHAIISNNKLNNKSKSFDNKDGIKYWKNKPYIYISPIFLIGLISIIIMAGGNNSRLQKYIKKGLRLPNSPNHSEEIKLITLNQEEEKQNLSKKYGADYEASSNRDQSLTQLTSKISSNDQVDNQKQHSCVLFSDKDDKSSENITGRVSFPENYPSDDIVGKSQDMLADINQWSTLDTTTTWFDELFPQLAENTLLLYQPLDNEKLLSIPDINHDVFLSNSGDEDQSDNVQTVEYKENSESVIEQTKLAEKQNKASSNFLLTPRDVEIVSCRESKILARKHKIQMPHMWTNNWKLQTSSLKITKDEYSYTILNDVIPPNIVVYIKGGIRCRMLFVNTTHSFKNKDEHPKWYTDEDKYFLKYNKSKVERIIKKWDLPDDNIKKPFINYLYNNWRLELRHPCTEEVFSSQVYSYFNQRSLSYRQQWTRPNSHRIFSSINDKIDSSKDTSLSADEKYVALCYLKNITKFERRHVYRGLTSFTSCGWFQKPRTVDARKIDLNNITKEDYIYLQEQRKVFSNIESLLPKSYETRDYYKILLEQIENNEIEPNVSQQDKFIENEIIHDLKEIINTYKSFINIEGINIDKLPKKLKQRFKFSDYLWKFGNNTCLTRNNYEGITQTGISEDTLLTLCTLQSIY